MGTASAIAKVGDDQIVVSSEAMRKLMAMVDRVARAPAAILITGETGAGKELIARAVHNLSLRATKPLIDINCAALPEHLVESELFGYEKGAFSGADSLKQGLFELADKGSLFLDEIGELDPKIQVKLLRVLDGVPYYRLGGNRKVSVDVRIIAATNQPLEDAVREGRFRSDLYHRLAQFQLRVPPLRSRPEDITALAEFFLAKQRPGASFSQEALAALRAYDWPGNARELRNVIMQAAVANSHTVIAVSDLPPEISHVQPTPAAAPTAIHVDLDTMERTTILKALEACGGQRGIAAAKLGISRRTLTRKLKQYELEPGDGAVLGSMTAEQFERFRVSADFPVTVWNSKGEEFEVTTVNVSIGGIAVKGIGNPFCCTGSVRVRFALPTSTTPIEASGTVVWADVHKVTGIRFDKVPEWASNALRDWICQHRDDEGWSVQAQEN